MTWTIDDLDDLVINQTAMRFAPSVFCAPDFTYIYYTSAS
jgi:hypothetical protein